MPNLLDYKKMLACGGQTVGQHHKNDSDKIMEQTWWNDIQAKRAYIYDWYHDDQRESNYGYDPSRSRTKTSIDVKFIIVQYQTQVKDAVEYHIQFKPSQPLFFSENDELYYYETDYRRRYRSTFPIGMFIDLPNEQGIYEKWLICGLENQNQFPKYSVLKCNYEYMWISEENGKRTKNRMWAVTRSQNSYNSGLWAANISTDVENQEKAIFPINPITEYFYYTHPESKQNQRMIISTLTKRPIVWQISKIESHSPQGLVKVTFYQDKFNDSADYVNLETGEMYADYYSSLSKLQNVSPLDQDISNSITCVILASVNTIKVGGSYKTLTFVFKDFGDIDITEKILSSTVLSWAAEIDGKDVTNNKDLIIWRPQDKTNTIKIKFGKDMGYVGKVLILKCIANYEGNNVIGTIELEIVSI